MLEVSDHFLTAYISDVLSEDTSGNSRWKEYDCAPFKLCWLVQWSLNLSCTV
jgi:hypothetical protein